MTLTIKKVNAATAAYIAGDRLFIHADVAGDASYPTGGSRLTPAMLGMSELHYVSGGVEPVTGVVAAFDYANGTLKAFDGATGKEVKANTDLSGKVWRVFAVGKGWPTLP